MALNVALVFRDHPYFNAREKRCCGYFSYPVPEFTWEHIIIQPGAKIDRSTLSQFDVIVCENEPACSFHGDGPPTVFLTWDGTLSQARFQDHRAQAALCDLVLVEHDQLDRYRCVGKPVRRLLFAVNDVLYHDYGLEKTVDVSCHNRLKNRTDRATLHTFLMEFCGAAGVNYAGGYIADPEEYARAQNRSKIGINLCKTPYSRNFGFFDRLASRTCLLNSPLPYISEDYADPAVHWREFTSLPEMAGHIMSLLNHDRWRELADAGYALMQRYKWSVRAPELRQILAEELGL